MTEEQRHKLDQTQHNLRIVKNPKTLDLVRRVVVNLEDTTIENKIF